MFFIIWFFLFCFGGRKEIHIGLAPTRSSLDEVVVVGYGTQKRKDVTGSVASVRGSVIKDQPVTAPVNLTSDEKGPPDEVATGGITFWVHMSGDRQTIRMRDVNGERFMPGADPRQRLPHPDGHGGLAVAGRGRRDRRHHHQLAVGPVAAGGQGPDAHLGLVVAVGDPLLRGEAQLARDLRDRPGLPVSVGT